MDERLEANRANWDDRVPIHVASRFYDVEGALPAPRAPRACETEALGAVDARYPWMVETEPGRYELPEGRPRIPLSFTLLASRPL